MSGGCGGFRLEKGQVQPCCFSGRMELWGRTASQGRGRIEEQDCVQEEAKTPATHHEQVED